MEINNNPTGNSSNNSAPSSADQGKAKAKPGAKYEVPNLANEVVSIPSKILEMSKNHMIRGKVTHYFVDGITQVYTHYGEVIFKTNKALVPGTYIRIKSLDLPDGVEITTYIEPIQTDKGLNNAAETIVFNISQKNRDIILLESNQTQEVQQENMSKELVNIDSPMFKLVGAINGGISDFLIESNDNLPIIEKILPDPMDFEFGHEIFDFLTIFTGTLEHDIKNSEYSQILTQLRSITDVAESSNWKLFLVPIYLGPKMSVIRFYAKKHTEKEKKSAQRFIVEFESSILGHVKVDGLYNFTKKELLMKFLSENDIPNNFKKELTMIFARANGYAKINGVLTFGQANINDHFPLSEVLASYCKSKVGDHLA
jgi:hypothetical protein